jgi:hypothetical protein
MNRYAGRIKFFAINTYFAISCLLKTGRFSGEGRVRWEDPERDFE